MIQIAKPKLNSNLFKWKIVIPLILVFTLFSCTNIKKSHESDIEIIYGLVAQMESQNLLRPLIDLPPPLPEYDISKLSGSAIDSALAANAARIEAYQQKHKRPELSNSTMIFPVSDTLLSSCNFCKIVDKRFLKRPEYQAYNDLLNKLRSGTKEKIAIDFKKPRQTKEYVFKPLSQFANDEDIYSPSTEYAKGGILYFSRVYSDGEMGIFYFEEYNCGGDCGAGYLVLIQKKAGRWHVVKAYRQWIS
jgi:hypothetical protein